MDTRETVSKDRRIVDRVVPLCLYCGDNSDALIAAWIVWDSYKGAVQCETVEQGVSPWVDVLGRDVIILGPLYQKSILLDLGHRAATVLWITTPNGLIISEEDNIKTKKGSTLSLASVAWHHYHPDSKAPSFMDIVTTEDFVRFHAAAINKRSFKNES